MAVADIGLGSSQYLANLDRGELRFIVLLHIWLVVLLDWLGQGADWVFHIFNAMLSAFLIRSYCCSSP